MSDRHFFSGVLRQIADEVGETAALKLAAARGGTQFNFPKRDVEVSELARIVGVRDAVAIVRLIGPGRHVIPTNSVRGRGARRRRAAEMLRQGKSLRETALACDMHQRTVELIKRDLNLVDERAPELPFDS